MDFTLLAIAQAALLASSLSLDAFTAGFAYGANKTRIPMLSAHIINLICAGITGFSLLVGSIVKPYLPLWLTTVVAFSVLFIIGLIKLLDGVTKAIIKKHHNINKKINCSFFNFKFVLYVYANPEAADIDASKHISSAEAALLALSLSLDGISVGFGAAFADVNGVAVFLWSLITNLAFLLFGHFLGHKITRNTSFNISWLSGVVFIGLALSKLFDIA